MFRYTGRYIMSLIHVSKCPSVLMGTVITFFFSASDSTPIVLQEQFENFPPALLRPSTFLLAPRCPSENH